MGRPVYVVDIARDEAGWWVASVRHVAGVHTQGRTIDEAERRACEALSLVRDDVSKAEFETRISEPEDARASIREFRKLKEKLEADRARFSKAARTAVRVLTTKSGLSVRDAAKLLGISHQRVQQLKESVVE